MLVRFAIGHREQPVPAQPALHEDAQPFSGPVRFRRFPQARFFLGGGARGHQAGCQAGHFLGQGFELAAFGDLMARGCSARAELVKPLRHARQGPAKTPADGKQRDAANQKSLNGHADQRATPQRRSLRIDIGRVMEDRKISDDVRIVAQRERDNMHGIAAQLQESGVR